MGMLEPRRLPHKRKLASAMTKTEAKASRPGLSRAAAQPVQHYEVVDQTGKAKQVAIPVELPLTIYIDGHEIVTLMTMGTNPEELTLGYLRNQRLLERIEDIESVVVDWARETAEVSTRQGHGIGDLAGKLSRVTVTSSCGQGTLFNNAMGKLEQTLPRAQVRQSTIYELLKAVASRNQIYRLSGSVHCCCLCQGGRVLMSVEDVGRHNAVDAVAGRMWLDGMDGADKIFFITGRFASEIVMKAALMGIPVIVSKAGITNRGLELAKDLGMVVIGRAKSSGFLVYNGWDQVVFDAVPEHA